MTEELIDLIINTEHQEIGSGAGKMLRAWSPLEKQLASELAALHERVAALEAFHEAARELNIMGLIPDLDQWENAEGEPIAVLVKWYIDTFRMAGGE